MHYNKQQSQPLANATTATTAVTANATAIATVNTATATATIKKKIFSLILDSNNLPLKIYCKNIIVTFLNFISYCSLFYFSYYLFFFHPNTRFFLLPFFFLFVFLLHTRTPLISSTLIHTF